MGLFGKLFNKETDDEKDLKQASAGRQQTSYDPSPDNDPFRLRVDDIFTIKDRGVVVTGRVESGSLKVGDVVVVNGTRQCEVAGIEQFRKILQTASAGDNVGILLSDITKYDINQGDILTLA